MLDYFGGEIRNSCLEFVSLFDKDTAYSWVGFFSLMIGQGEVMKEQMSVKSLKC